MQGDEFGVVMVEQLGHHDSIGEIPADAFLGSGEGDAIDHLIDFIDLLLIHICDC